MNPIKSYLRWIGPHPRHNQTQYFPPAHDRMF